jgi:hypothetical protein
MLFDPGKTLIAYNKDTLDTYHDIEVSFDYAFYSEYDVPRGGFCLVFFETSKDVPTIGGPGPSLGYTPNSQSDYCYDKGYKGFAGGYMGIGFDMNGEFGLKTDLVDGLTIAVPNSCNIRGSEAENYKYIASSKNLLYSSKPILIGEQAQGKSNIKFKSIRIIISRAFTEIEVQIKNVEERKFTTILTTKIPTRQNTGVRVGLTHTTIDSYSKLLLKNFNVAGFPGIIAEPELTDCASIDKSNKTMQGKTIVSAQDFVAIPVNGDVKIYSIKNGNLTNTQTIQEEAPSYLIGGNDKFLFLNKYNTYDIEVYYKSNNSFLKTQTISMTAEIDNLLLAEIGGFPECADTDNKTLAVGNNKNIYLWQFFTGSSTYGYFNYIQSLTDNVSGDIGYSVQVENGVLLTGGGTPRISGRRDSFVAYYKNNGLDWIDTPIQMFTSPATGNRYDEFGYSINLQGKEAVIGSPNEIRKKFNTLGHGEAYHYVFATNKKTGIKEWVPALGLGSFFNLNTPAGNFGTSLAFLGNNLIVSAPYENYLYPPDYAFEDKPNSGRVYLFKKTKAGTFTQAAIVAPDYSRAKNYMLFGRYVGLLGKSSAIVGVPYTSVLYPSEIDAYKFGCIFTLPPPHLPININSIALYDGAGYIIDIETLTYMQLLKYDIV